MDEVEDDDIYAPDEHSPQEQMGFGPDGYQPTAGSLVPQDEESGEEFEEESDSDIDIITEKKDEPKKEAAQDPRVNELKKPTAAPSSSNETKTLPPASARHDSPFAKPEGVRKASQDRTGASYPPVKTSTVDVDYKPMYESNNKPITEIDMDADLGENDKAWRRPGSDMADYFNYGFDEFTWANYCLKQQSLRKETSDSKKQLDDMQSFLNSGMPGMPGASGGGIPSMPTLGDIPPEMQQMFGQMMSQGMDPSQMDPSTFMQMMSGAQAGQGGDPSQGYGAQNYGQHHNQQQMGYGYGGGNQGGRGRGRRW